MNMLCMKILPFKWDSPREYWYVAIQGADQDFEMVEFDILRPTSLFVMEFRSSQPIHESNWFRNHCKTRRSNRPCTPSALK